MLPFFVSFARGPNRAEHTHCCQTWILMRQRATIITSISLSHSLRFPSQPTSSAQLPRSAHRAMAKAADLVYSAILRDGHQKNVVDLMQTRNELYESVFEH